ncbi:glycerol kinase [Naematelia encephala]|uniref:glycerol kinase n=1 Tax=Naematelia encephala TaxID=71784 RepID=A0A1Y2B104_9TREE|nr:glycerol kinase [Naematelia encephala]
MSNHPLQSSFTPLEASPKSSPPAFPSDASPIHSPYPSRPSSRRPSLASGNQPLPPHPGASLSRRSSMASGPRPITKAEYSGPSTPSLLSRAGSPTQPLMNERVASRRGSFVNEATARLGGFGGLGGMSGMSALDTKRELRQGEFIGSVDCGTTSTRFIVFDDKAKIICEHQTEFNQILPHAGWHEQDPMELVNSMRDTMHKAIEKLEWMGWSKDSVKGIGITNQRETTLCWSRSTGKPLCNAIVWDDARTVALVRHYEKLLDEEGIDVDDEDEPDGKLDVNGVSDEVTLGTSTEDAAFGHKGDVVTENDGGVLGRAMETLGLAGRGKEGVRKRKGKEALVDVTGIPLSTYFSAIKLRWMLDHHREVHDAHEADDLLFGTVDSWLVYNLTGGIDGGLHIMDVTNASRTLLISLKTLQWHPPLLRFFGLRPSILPKIVSCSELYGHIHKNMDSPLTGVPIAGIVGDQQAALVGNKCLRKGEAKNTYGTGAFVLFNTGEELVRSNYGLISTVAYQAGPGAKPVYALEGSIAVAGSAIKWLRDQMNLIEESSEMDMLAGSVKDNGGVYFVTAFSGLLAPYWDRDAAGTIIGLTAYTTSAHIARATLEAVCYQSRAVLDVIEKESGVRLDTLKVDGGVTNSDLAMQLQANIGGFNVSRPSMRESTALGSALLAAHAIGLYGWNVSEPSTLDKVNTADEDIFEPEISEEERLRMIGMWERAVERAKGWHTAEEEDKAETDYEKEMNLEKIQASQ